ncbi:hypothetical protein Amal_03612 [Acetobacter malorum]|uniref:Uncharacterized protein n=1 Tax=Acetobacter malorum TaxID=178901 RepID=A0A177G4C6_9PROT|nr:hypothetical protein Amal_03612 [Acetobacter malorum]
MRPLRCKIHAGLCHGQFVEDFFNPGGAGSTGHTGEGQVDASFIHRKPGFADCAHHGLDRGGWAVHLHLRAFRCKIDRSLHTILTVQNFFNPRGTGCAGHATNGETDGL